MSKTSGNIASSVDLEQTVSYRYICCNIHSAVSIEVPREESKLLA